MTKFKLKIPSLFSAVYIYNYSTDLSLLLRMAEVQTIKIDRKTNILSIYFRLSIFLETCIRIY